VNVFYSTPSIYAARKISQNLPLTTKRDDFFPYDIFKNGYLSGYYSSREALKGYIRQTSAFLQAAIQLQPFQQVSSSAHSRTPDIHYPSIDPSDPLWPLHDAMGIAQHHDAISGEG
jgi:hypothetical protein